MQVPGEEDEYFRVEEREVIETVLPAHDGTDHEESGTAEKHHGEEGDDLGVRGGKGVRREGEL